MNEMVEKVAKALHKSFGYHEVENCNYCNVAARVAIEAMKEPTEKMIISGSNEDEDYHDDFRDAYKRMIQAALDDL